MQHAFSSLTRALLDRRALLLLTAVIAIAVVGCRTSGSNPSSDDQKIPVIKVTTSPQECINSIQPEDAPKFADIDTSRFETLVEGLRYYEITPGTGGTPQIVDAVSVEYTGWLQNGCMFDTSYVNEGPVTFPLLNMITGWQESLTSMKEGSTWAIEVAPELAYGPVGYLPRIGPDATLVFTINLLNKVTIAEAQATLEAERALATVEAADAAATAEVENATATAEAQAAAETATVPATAEALPTAAPDVAIDATAEAVESVSEAVQQ